MPNSIDQEEKWVSLRPPCLTGANRAYRRTHKENIDMTCVAANKMPHPHSVGHLQNRGQHASLLAFCTYSQAFMNVSPKGWTSLQALK